MAPSDFGAVLNFLLFIPVLTEFFDRLVSRRRVAWRRRNTAQHVTKNGSNSAYRIACSFSGWASEAAPAAESKLISSNPAEAEKHLCGGHPLCSPHAAL